jgi:hypothetical protein
MRHVRCACCGEMNGPVAYGMDLLGASIRSTSHHTIQPCDERNTMQALGPK